VSWRNLLAETILGDIEQHPQIKCPGIEKASQGDANTRLGLVYFRYFTLSGRDSAIFLTVRS
jgi:hypothetical protein